MFKSTLNIWRDNQIRKNNKLTKKNKNEDQRLQIKVLTLNRS